MKKIYLGFIAIAAMFNAATAQIGATAPDFTVTDIDGVEHNLYDYLDQGKVVIVDVSATWCGPCWGFHTAHFLEDIWAQYGPDGTNEVMVLFYEGDDMTTLADLQGSTGGTQGDWLTGTEYPVVNEDPLSLNLNVWAPLGFPTINVIRPSDKEIIEDFWNQWTQASNNEDALADMIDVIEEAIPAASVAETTVNTLNSIYPNPGNGDFQVNYSAKANDNVVFEVVNTLGQVVFTSSMPVNAGTNRIQMNLTSLATGNYILRAVTKDEITTTTFQKI